ncbi:contractile injection system tape measure protein [Photorhabdus akhurstii]|uniref:contractile injection system tape measure protein n=1 Tax=Photorhabdus akhurstii TaxID=171438 RepID=UPI001C2EA3D7|nr:contractile injection system tape measure protein [Photorhabdus akhurstii]
MISEPILLRRIIITIEVNNSQVAKKVLHGSLLNQSNIHRLLNSFFDQHTINQDIYFGTLTLNLGETKLHDFNSLFPVQLNTALSQALNQYQINNQAEKTLTEESISQKVIDKVFLLHDNDLINAENFIYYLYQKDSIFNPIKQMMNNKDIDINIKKLINQITQIESKLALLLAKSCLSEHSLQQLLAIGQPALLNAISYRLLEGINRTQDQEELVSSGQLVLNALGYIQRNNTQEIPKPDAKVISHITVGLDSDALNAASVIELFRQTVIYNSSLNEWLEQLWQTESVSQLCKKHLSIQEYKNLAKRFNRENPPFREQPLQQTTSVDLILTEILQTLATGYKQHLPQLSQHQLSLIATAIQQGEVKIQNILQLFKHPVLYNSEGTAWLAPLWQLAPVSQLCKKHISAQEYKNLVKRFDRENQPFRKQSLQQTTIVDSILTEILQALATGHKQHLPQLNQHQLSLITTAIQQGDIKTQNILRLFQHPMLYNSEGTTWLAPLWQLAPVSLLCKKHLSAEEYQYLSERFMLNHTIISENRQTLSASDNLRVTGNNQLRTINRARSKSDLLPEQTFPRQVSNAGILVLWPMLSALFNQLSLLETQKFIHRQAQFSAVNFLDYLIWGTKETPAERKILNNILCGLMTDETTESVLIEPEKQLVTEQWLDAVISQLPAWKKLSRNDARQLFLQRPGELLINEQETKITVQHQPFDVLLTDWPWPLNIAKLPWLDRPLLIDWQNI